jgi:hypothetical protein
MISGANEPAADNNSPASPSQAEVRPIERSAQRRRRQRLGGAVVSTATKLLPLVELLETIQPHVANESIFHTKRVKINAQIALVYAQLKSERPKRKALMHAFKTMGEVIRDETRELDKDDVKDATKEFVLATIKNAPGLIGAAHQAGLLS